MSYTDLPQSWKNVTKITTAGALVAALACISGPARADEVISNAHVSETPPATPYSSQPSFNQSFCPPSSDYSSAPSMLLKEAGVLSEKKDGQVVFLGEEDADFYGLFLAAEIAREKGINAEVVKVLRRSEEGSVVPRKGNKAYLVFNGRLVGVPYTPEEVRNATISADADYFYNKYVGNSPCSIHE